jgi:tryptophan synthase alpha chain
MTASRIQQRFAELREEKRPALIIYLTVGDPSLFDSLACAKAALAAGADMLELGVPFSDPTSDGPVIAAASQRALRAGGSLKSALTLAGELRKESEAPLVLFTYLNPILAYGAETLPAALVAHGVDGLLVVDLPPEEGAELRDAARAAEVALIPLVAPTTSDDRAARIVKEARGFVYYVSLTGVTGAGDAPLAEAGERARALAERSGLPVAVGFGIDTPDKARRVAQSGVDGVVVGSAVVKAMAQAPDADARVAAVSELVSSLRAQLG